MPLGRQIVEAETRLDRLFAARDAHAPAVEGLARAIGALQGRLRAVHLRAHRAHLEVQDVLASAQVGRYGVLRGYAPREP